MSFYLPVNVTVLLSFLIFVLYLLGVQNMITSFPKNDCEMTYMFQYPQFVEISLPPEIRKTYFRYTLYGYSEGGFTVQLRKMKFKGIPVLFIPGSSGSYKQGRSLASISLRKSLNSRTPFHFNYFMIDFNEEQSGIYGGVLTQQTKFTSHCIKKILSLYQNNEGSKPQSLILIGHSLGGIVAKGVFLDPGFDPQLVKLIVTLASPHKYPLIQFDYFTTSYYKNVNNFWKNNSNLSHINLVSIGGGLKDIIVRSDVTFDMNADVNVISSGLPGVWLSNDHLSITWCKQLILTIVRALFDSVDTSTMQLSTDKKYINSVLEYHFLKRSAGKKFGESLMHRISKFERTPHWFENLQRQFTITKPQGLNSNHYIMIRLFSEPKSEVAYIEAININVKDWVYVCSADLVHNSIRMCEDGENLSNYTEIAPVSPESKVKRKFVYLNLFELKEKSFSHVVVKIPSSENFMSVSVDVYKASDRSLNYNVPRIYAITPKTIISNTQSDAISYYINLVGFEYIWQSYILTIEELYCKSDRNDAVVSFITPWFNGSQHYFFEKKKSLEVSLGLLSPKPKHFNETLHPTIRLHLDPTCQYSVKIHSSVIGVFTQGARYYSLMLPAFLATVILLTVRQQLLFLDGGKCVLFHSALSTAVRHYYLILQASILGSKLLGFGLFLSVLPVPDFSILQELNLDSFFFVILLYAAAIIITYSTGAACYVAIVMSSQMAHKMALRFLAKTVSGIINWSEWIISALHQVPIIAAIVLISLSLSTCGAIALWLGTFFYFLKICKMYEEYLDELFNLSINFLAKTVKKVIGSKTHEKKPIDNQLDSESKETNSENFDENDKSESKLVEKSIEGGSPRDDVDLLSSIHFHTSVFLIWLLASFLYVPSLLMWAKNYHHNIILENDPSVIPSVVISACGAILWQPNVPRKSKFFKVTSGTLMALAIGSIIYASVSLYRLGYLLSASLIVLSINHGLSLL